MVKRNILWFIEPIREGVETLVSCESLWCNNFLALSWLAKQVIASWYEPIRNGVRRPVVINGLRVQGPLQVEVAKHFLDYNSTPPTDTYKLIVVYTADIASYMQYLRNVLILSDKQ